MLCSGQGSSGGARQRRARWAYGQLMRTWAAQHGPVAISCHAKGRNSPILGSQEAPCTHGNWPHNTWGFCRAHGPALENERLPRGGVCIACRDKPMRMWLKGWPPFWSPFLAGPKQQMLRSMPSSQHAPCYPAERGLPSPLSGTALTPAQRRRGPTWLGLDGARPVHRQHRHDGDGLYL